MAYVEQFFESESSNRRIVHAIARAMGVEPSDVESDALYRLTVRPASADVPFPAALRQAARQAAIDIKRSAHSRRVTGSLDATTQDDAGETYQTHAEPSHVMTPDALLATREAYQMAMQALTKGERAALVGGADGSSRVMRSRAKSKLTAAIIGR